MNLNLKPIRDTLYAAKLTPGFYENKKVKEELDLKEKFEKAFLINQFWDIGWADPFIDDERSSLIKEVTELKLPTKPDDLVYDKSRFKSHMAPNCIYIPKKIIMLKLMRACIKCQSDSDFWVNQDDI